MPQTKVDGQTFTSPEKICEYLAEYVADSFSESLVSGIYPDVLKIAQVIPLHKGGSTLELGNYRLISILSPINEIFETILHKRLSKFWGKYNLFVNCQFGFKKKTLNK